MRYHHLFRMQAILRTIRLYMHTPRNEVVVELWDIQRVRWPFRLEALENDSEDLEFHHRWQYSGRPPKG
jgi:hypothetical protein